MGERTWLHVLRKVGLFFVAPILVFSCIYYLVNPGHLSKFNTSFYLDAGDGYQNVWNNWWVNKSIVDHRASPYQTDYLHFPSGVSLATQTMNIYNGLVGIVLINFLGASLVQATNIAVLTGFIGTGLTMFWLLYYLFRRYEAALLGGGMFAFSSYHFAHGIGHLQLISLQFVPLFVLAFLVFMRRLRWQNAIYAGITLALVGLCDYYYLLYCCIFAGGYVLFKVFYRELEISWRSVKLFLIMAISGLAILGWPIYLLLQLTSSQTLLGSHDARAFSMDLLSPLIPGGNWRWYGLTDWYWSRLPGYHSETSIFFGFGLISLLLFALLRLRKKLVPRDMYFWWVIAIMFGILGLGPRLRIFGGGLELIPLPYALLERLVPTFKISGMPVRMVVMSLLAAIVIAMQALSTLSFSTRKVRALFVVLVLVTALDVWPRPQPLSATTAPNYVTALKQLPPGAIIDNGANTATEALFFQTIHERKMAFGYVTRLPEVIDKKDRLLEQDLEAGRYDYICQLYRIRYLITRADLPIVQYPAVYSQPKNISDPYDNLRIYDLKNSDQC